jgi:hypothetical protein
METLDSVTDLPNKIEHYEGMYESAKGSDEDVTSDKTTKPPGTDDSEKPPESGEEANILTYFKSSVVWVCVAPVIVSCPVIYTLVLCLRCVRGRLAPKTNPPLEGFSSQQSLLNKPNRAEQNSSNSARPILQKVNKLPARS